MKERILRILKNSKKALSEEELKDAIGIGQEEERRQRSRQKKLTYIRVFRNFRITLMQNV